MKKNNKQQQRKNIPNTSKNNQAILQRYAVSSQPKKSDAEFNITKKIEEGLTLNIDGNLEQELLKLVLDEKEHQGLLVGNKQINLQ